MLSARLTASVVDCIVGPSVNVVRIASAQRHIAKRMYSKISRPVLLGKLELVTGFAIFGGTFENSDNNQNHNRLCED